MSAHDGRMPMLDDTANYRALAARDARFDGLFWTAVKTTGIYCRPVCPARTPKFANVLFFAHPAAAENAGFRPCLRCRPELSPRADLRLSPMDAPAQLAASAARLLEADPSRSVRVIAGKIGISERHLNRIFISAFGVTPSIYARTLKLLLAQQLLRDTPLPITQVAYAAGFSSVRRFNQVLLVRYGMAPQRIRQTGKTASGSALEVKLGYRGTLDWRGLLDFLAARAAPGVEVIDEERYARTLTLDAHAGWFTLKNQPGSRVLCMQASASLEGRLPALISCVRQAFDLNADTEQIERALSGLQGLSHGLRLPGTVAPFDTAVRAILGQQISVRAATTLASRLSALLGKNIASDPRIPAGLTRYAPSAESLANATVAELAGLGIIQTRARAVVELARATLDGRVDFSAQQGALIDALCALPGIGRWTANYLAMRALSAPDACLADDLLIKRAFEKSAGQTLKAREVQRHLQTFSPWRSYAALQIWRGAYLSVGAA